MLRLYHVLLGGILLVLVPLGIKVFSPNWFGTKDIPQRSPAISSSPSSTSTDNLWKYLLDKTATPTGWKVAACDGDAPLMCVFANGKLIGTVEIGRYPLDKQQNFEKMLRQAGIEPGQDASYQNPQYQTKVLTALNAWVNDLYSVLSKNSDSSSSSKGDRVVFDPHPPQKVQVGKLQGLSYGFTKLKSQGQVQEHHLGYVAFDGKALYVITTGFNGNYTLGKFDKLEDLTVFAPYLAAIASHLRLSPR